MKIGVVIEKGDRNYSAYVPDLPGCVSTGGTLQEVRQKIQEAIELHVEGMREDGQAVPTPTTVLEYVETTAA